MFDKRLFKELTRLKLYLPIGVAASIAALSLTIYQAFLISSTINYIFIKKGLFTNIVNSLILLGLIIFCRAVVNGLLEYYNHRSAIFIKHEIRKEIIRALVNIGPVGLKNEKTGRIASIAQEGVEAFDAYYSEFIPQILLVAVSIPMLLFVVSTRDFISGIIMFVTAPLIPIFMMLIGAAANHYNKKQWKSIERMGGHFLDVLKGLTTLKLYGKSKTQTGVIWRVSEEFRSTTMGVLKISFLSALVLELLATISTAIISVTLGVRLIYGQLQFQEAFFILLLIPEYYQPLRQLGAKFHAAMGASAAADSIYPVLQDNTSAGNKIENNDTNDLSLNRIEISVKELRFSYDNVNPVLRGISMDIGYGDRIALVGPSGSGKSTLISLLMGFVKGYDGSIRINGVELKGIDIEKWRSYIAYVPQHPKIFKNTILENIRMSKPEASYEEILEASIITGADSFIGSFPEKYDTLIGEGGISISGGQMQLLAITRAYLKGTELLILDEPTSALDPNTERMINNALDIISRNKTILTIAHRIPTIIKADMIYVIENGEIYEYGKHETLMNKKGLYHSLLTTWEVTK